MRETDPVISAWQDPTVHGVAFNPSGTGMLVVAAVGAIVYLAPRAEALLRHRGEV